MDNYRKQIDEIDVQLMELMNQRFILTKKIGEYKRKNNINVSNPDREEEVLKQASQYLYSEEIRKLYRNMFFLNKQYQEFRYGLIGKKLPYTISPLIYEKLGIKDYKVVETVNFKNTMEKLVYSGLNITIPYKSQAFDYCEKLDYSAEVTKTVNTIIDKKGYNTDYLGFISIFKKLGIDFTNSKVLIIGNGATSRTVYHAVNTKTVFLVRTIRTKNEYYISDYEQFSDFDYIFNTTPYGTYPDLMDKPMFPLKSFKNLKMVFDVVYNPLHTPLIKEAKKYGIKYMNGLNLLVEQASISYNLFMNENYDRADAIIDDLKKRLYNIVFIGLSYSGKTVIGDKISKILSKEFIDIDEELRKDGHDLNTLLLNNHSESVFREYEKQMAVKHGAGFNKVISTGGGTVLSEIAMSALSNNAIIVYLDLPIDKLISRIDNTRPLIKSSEDLLKLYQERKRLYEKYSDIRIEDECSIDEIVEKINETINYKWS